MPLYFVNKVSGEIYNAACAFYKSSCGINNGNCTVYKSNCAINKSDCAINKSDCGFYNITCAVYKGTCAIHNAACANCIALVICCEIKYLVVLGGLTVAKREKSAELLIKFSRSRIFALK